MKDQSGLLRGAKWREGYESYEEKAAFLGKLEDWEKRGRG